MSTWEGLMLALLGYSVGNLPSGTVGSSIKLAFVLTVFCRMLLLARATR